MKSKKWKQKQTNKNKKQTKQNKQKNKKQYIKVALKSRLSGGVGGEPTRWHSLPQTDGQTLEQMYNSFYWRGPKSLAH